MNIPELKEKLNAEGHEGHYAIESNGDNVFCLYRKRGKWEVAYMERGLKAPPIFSTKDLSEACSFFYDYISGMDSWDCVCIYKNKKHFQKLRQELNDKGIKTIENHIPDFNFQGDFRYRLFAINENLFEVKKLFKSLPLRD